MAARFFLVILLFALAGCAAQGIATVAPTMPQAAALPVFPTAGEPGIYQPTACRFALPDGFKPGINVDCGYLTVDEKRGVPQDTGNRRILLAVAIFHPPGGAKFPDPVIYLSGGPGSSALEAVRYTLLDVFAEPIFAAGRDLVFFDQRGVGLSRPALDCPEFDRLALDMLAWQKAGREVSQVELTDLYLERLLACRTDLQKKADLSAYNSAASAADVEDLRRALGYEQVNLWGSSYGTRLALEVMRRYPEGLRSVVLDAVYPPDVDLFVSTPANFERSLGKLFSACAENQVCNEAFPDLRTVFFATVDRLNKTPVLREIQNPLTGEKYSGRMSGDTLLALTFQLLYDNKLRYLLPQQIYAASQEDYTAFDQARGGILASLPFSSRGMMFSVLCHEEFPFSSLETFETALARHPQVASIYANAFIGGLTYRVCPEWGAGQADETANQPVFSRVPTLVINGEFDPITPPEWGFRAAETLEKAYVYEYPGLGHGSSVVADCPSGMMVAFVKDPSTAPDSACIGKMGVMTK